MFHFSTFTYDENVQSELKTTLTAILEMYGCREILIPIYTCINELLVNAIKANYKNLYFENYAIDSVTEQVPYEKALQLFRLEISSNRIGSLSDLARKNDMSAEVQAKIEDGVLTIKVINQTEMTEREKANVLAKLKMAEKIDTISDLYSISEKDPYKEGAGLGIVFVGIMLKSLALSPDHLTINSADGQTTAVLRVPLNPATVEAYQNYKVKKDGV